MIRRVIQVCWSLALCALVAASLAPLTWAAGKAEVRIIRDDYGVPHIYADDLGALFYGYGYATAQDRLFQLEMTRRCSWGTVAEVLGEEFVDLDTDQRRVGYTLLQVREQMSRLAPEYRTMLRAYADGINNVIDLIEKGKSAMPPEFGRVGFRPSRWTGEDVAQLFIAFMGTRYSDGHVYVEARDAEWLQGLTAKFGAEKARTIFDDLIQSKADPQMLTTIPKGEKWQQQVVPSGPRSGNWSPPEVSPPQSGIVPSGIAQIAARMEAAANRQQKNLDRLGVPLKLGSYGWVVGSNRTLNGSAMLLGGPQMGWFSPAYVYEVGLHGAGFNLVGNTPIGHLPVLFGHNAKIAWSATAGNGDVADLFVEKLDPKDHTRYQFKGEWRKLEVREEIFKVKGKPDVKETFYRSVHGPIENLDEENHLAYARARGFANLELESMAGWIDGGRAQNFEQFVAASRRNALSITWIYADTRGQCGMAYCGRTPRRHPQQDPRFPTPGTGEREWLGFIPVEQVPHMVNPKRGFLVNWNNQPAYEWPYNPGIFTGRPNRSNLIFDFFDAKPVITLEDVKESVRYASFVDGAVPFFRPWLLDSVRLLGSKDPELTRAAALVKAWDGLCVDRDGNGKYDGPGITIFNMWYKHLAAEVFTDANAGPIAKYLQARKGQNFGLPQGGSVLLSALEGKRSSAPMKLDYLGGLPAEQVMVTALRKAVRELTRTYGPDPQKWLTPVVMSSFSTSNYLGVTTGFDEIRKFPPMRRGTENHIVVLSSAGVRGIDIVPPGQSGVAPRVGHPSPHYADQADMFVNFQYKPMHFYPQDVEFATRSIEELEYNVAAAR